MSRLILELTSNEQQQYYSGDSRTVLSVTACVSYADTGLPVTHLTKNNFKFTFVEVDTNLIYHLELDVEEKMWYPDQTPSGIYDIAIRSYFFDSGKKNDLGFKDQLYSIGIQVSFTKYEPSQSGRPIDHQSFQGQSVISIVNV